MPRMRDVWNYVPRNGFFQVKPIYLVYMHVATVLPMGLHVFESKAMAKRFVEANAKDGPWVIQENVLIGADLICGKCHKPDHRGIDCKEGI